MMSSLICDCWWHLKIVELECRRSSGSVKIEDDIVWLGTRAGLCCELSEAVCSTQNQ